MARPVQDVTCDVCLHIVAGGLDGHAHEDKKQHQKEALNSTENVDELGSRQGNTAGQSRCHDATHVEEAMPSEERRDPRIESRIDGI